MRRIDLGAALDEDFPTTDLDHYLPASRISARPDHETIPEEMDEDELEHAGMEGAAQEGIVDDDLEVNMSKH